MSKGTIITHLSGGLGTQMFQYAFGRRVSLETGFSLKLDKNETAMYGLNNFMLEENFADKLEIIKIKQRALGGSHIKEKTLIYDPELPISINRNAYIDGLWQNESYFKTVSSAIRADFAFRREPVDLNRAIAAEIFDANSVAIHVRRGNFVEDMKMNALHGTCSIDYYKRATQYIEERVRDPSFFIFTDDPEWVKENLDFHETAVLITDNEYTPQDDLFLMALCKHFIIANSAFSWWGAWLCDYEGKFIVAPKQWYQHEGYNNDFTLPKTWMRL